jgi:hypothetical protein
MALAPPIFFPLANALDDSGGPLFPGIRFIVNLSVIAVKMNKWPSEVYERYLSHPRDIELVLAAYEQEKKAEDKERNKIEEQQARISQRHGIGR